MKVTGTIVRNPVVKDKVIFSSIKTEDAINPVEIVLFRLHRPTSYADHLAAAKENDKITLVGRYEKNPRNNETQIIIDEIDVPINWQESSDDDPCWIPVDEDLTVPDCF